MLIVSCVLFFILSCWMLRKELSILQTQFYEIKRYLFYKKNKYKNRMKRVILISLILIHLLCFIYLKYKLLVVLFPISLFLLAYEKRAKEIVKFKITSRIKRIICIYSLIYFSLCLLMIYLSQTQYIYLFFFELLIMISYKLFISLIVLIDYVLEKIINIKYRNKAIKKLKRVNPI